jgi:Putative metal-binding motif
MRLPRLLLPLMLGACDGKATTDTACDGLDAWPDDDGDGWGDTLRATSTCESGANLVDQGGDCDDGDAAVGPGAEESCNGRDDDCDGEIDESPVDGRTWYLDLDGDGEGDPATAFEACATPTGAVETATDCDDTCASCNNSGTELCGNGLDEDCDGSDGVCDEGGDFRGDAVADMRLFGELANDQAGYCLANIGDVDLDGGDDLAVSAIGRDGHTGLVYLAAAYLRAPPRWPTNPRSNRTPTRPTTRATRSAEDVTWTGTAGWTCS